jgi:tellurite methyltransferase
MLWYNCYNMTDEEKSTPRTSEFYEVTRDNPPSQLLVDAVPLVSNKGTALDLGCGAGRDTKYLLAQGFEVTAVDANSQTRELIARLSHQDKLHYVNSSFETFPFREYDLINAQWSLPFNSKATFGEMFQRMKSAIKPGGVFTGQLFGINDEWNKPKREMTFNTEEDAKQLFA